MKYLIIVEQDESKWDDETGVKYNFPKNYKGRLTHGAKFIYYKGKLQDKKYREERASDDPYYFGVGMIGLQYPNEEAKNEYYVDIQGYEAFENMVPAMVNGVYLEEVPDPPGNYWRNSVREVSEEIFNKILVQANMSYEKEFTVNEYGISAKLFDEVYEQYLDFVKFESEGQEFNGFNEGFMYKREAYKSEIREKALQILNTEEWIEDWIGSGKIAKRIVGSLEIEGNNLVDTSLQYGPDSVPHRDIIQALETGEKLNEIEQVLYDLFKSKDSPESCFNRMVDLVGKKYSMLAYFYYLKNDREYLPISTTNFENALEVLGSDLKLSRKCSWENYSAYLKTIKQVKEFLEVKLEEDINFIDAHSFLFLIGYRDRFRNWLKEKDVAPQEIVFEVIHVNPVNNASNKRSTRSTETDTDSNADWEKIEKKKRLRGRKAEELVMEYERKRLVKASRPDLAAKVEDYSKKFGKGFDVLSWNVDGSKRCIEVKASSNNGFMITRNEVNKSEINPDYWIYIVNEKKNGKVQIKTIQGPALKDESKFRLEPATYFVSFSIES